MAIIVLTTSPGRLLRRLHAAIDDGTIANWNYDGDGDFTYLHPEWRQRAWLSPRVSEGRLIFNTVPRKGVAMSTGVYAVYHARFVELLLAHFDSQFESVRVTAAPTPGDAVE